jgi:hypothetical protein
MSIAGSEEGLRSVSGAAEDWRDVHFTARRDVYPTRVEDSSLGVYKVSPVYADGHDASAHEGLGSIYSLRPSSSRYSRRWWR